MNTQIIKESINRERQIENREFEFRIDDKIKINVYSNSFLPFEGNIFFIGKEGIEKSLYILSNNSGSKLLSKFEGEEFGIQENPEFKSLKKCCFNTKNRRAVQEIFDFTNPRVFRLVNSFGLGDRIGLANPGHIRSLGKGNFKPILAQQSIRELTRTQRKPEEVINAAVFAVLQEGYKDGFGADADHLKTTDDIDLMLDAGFKMFTFDPGEHVDNNADNYSEKDLEKIVGGLNWIDLSDTLEQARKRYANREFKISSDLTLNVSGADCLRAYAKYGKAIAHIRKMYNHLLSKISEDKFVVEASVDETESVTSLFEHFFFANELTRLNISFSSLAPRFVGDFEKGIDYKGDLDLFKSEYEKHLAIAKYFANYRISLHSGSDKFSLYKVIGSIKGSYIHVKTAGTSYLEALRVVAVKEPDLFREILDYAVGLYNVEKESYHVSADIKKIKRGSDYSNEELLGLFSDNNSRQVLHVTFGRILTEKDQTGKYLFKDRIVKCLKENEEIHYNVLIKHFQKHLEPFKEWTEKQS